jgi:hypothetical protein
MDMVKESLKNITDPAQEGVTQERIAGWGSGVEIRFKKDGNEIERVAEPEDMVEAANYLNFITAQK